MSMNQNNFILTFKKAGFCGCDEISQIVCYIRNYQFKFTRSYVASSNNESTSLSLFADSSSLHNHRMF